MDAITVAGHLLTKLLYKYELISASKKLKIKNYKQVFL